MVKDNQIPKDHRVLQHVLHKNRRHHGKLARKGRESYCSHDPASFLLYQMIFLASSPLGGSLNAWWDDTLKGLLEERRREASGALIYAMWGT